MQLTHKTAWITGASSGIGRALALDLARRGAGLILSARHRPSLEEVAARCREAGSPACEVLPLDTSDPEGIAAAAQSVRDRYKELHLLVHCAGVSQRASVLHTSMEVDRRIMEVNYFGVIGLTKEVLPLLLQTPGSAIIAVSSLSGKFGFYGRASYAASKHALHGFFESLRFELQERVKILLACPGYVKTAISYHSLKGDGSAHGHMDDTHQDAMPPEEAARRIIRALEAGKREVIFGGKEEWMWRFHRWWPALFYRVGLRLGKRFNIH